MRDSELEVITFELSTKKLHNPDRQWCLRTGGDVRLVS